MSVHDKISEVFDICTQFQNDVDDLHVDFDDGNISEADAAKQLRDLVMGGIRGMLNGAFEAVGAVSDAATSTAAPSGHEEVCLEDLNDDVSAALINQSEEAKVNALNTSQNEFFYYVQSQPNGTKKVTRRPRTDEERIEAEKSGCGASVEVKY